MYRRRKTAALLILTCVHTKEKTNKKRKEIEIEKGLNSPPFPKEKAIIPILENVKDVEHGMRVRVRRTINNGGGSGSSSGNKLRQWRKGG